jgi:hypothetical protein
MKRIEVACVPRGYGSPNEDFAAVAVGNEVSVFIVLDGVGGSGIGCRHGVPWFTTVLGTSLLRWASSHPGLPLRTCLERAIGDTAGAHSGTCDLTHPQTPQTTVAAARWGQESVEYLLLSDSTLLLESPDGVVTAVLDPPLARLRPDMRARLSELDALLAAAPPGTAEYRTAAENYRRSSGRLRNAPDGFFTAASDPETAARALTGTVPRSDVRSLTGLTDGAASWVEIFGLGTWRECVSVLRQEGASGLVRQVRAAEAGDPGMSLYQRDKPGDDASVVFVEF